MLQYPMKFTVRSSTKPGIAVNWQTSADAAKVEMTAAIPPEFAGPGGGVSAEDFYALAMVNCYISTFKVYAEKSSLEFEDISAVLTLEVDRDEKGFPWMARATMNVQLRKPSVKEKGQALMEKALKGCLVMNSIKTEKTVQFEILD